MKNQCKREQDKALSVWGAFLIVLLLATISFLPLYIIARMFLSANREDSLGYAVVGSILGVPLLGFVYVLSCFGGITFQEAIGEPTDASMLVEPLFWAGFLPTYFLTSIGISAVLSSEFSKTIRADLLRRAFLFVSLWTATLLTGLWVLIASLGEFEDDAVVRSQGHSVPVQMEPRKPISAPPPPIQVTTITSTGLESHLWNSQYHLLSGQRTLSLSTGQLIWDRAYVWITADYNSLIEGKIRLLNSESGKGVEIDYQGISITVQGSRTINWSRNGHREVGIGASGEMF